MNTGASRPFSTMEFVQPTRREMLIGGMLLAATITSFVLKPRERQETLGSAKLETLVPRSFAGWTDDGSSGLVLPPADQLRDQTYSQLLTRVYKRSDGASVMLLIAYGGSQDGTIQIHRPEVCYPASGFKLTQIEDGQTDLSSSVQIPSRFIVARTDLRTEQLVYWTRLGEHFPRSWLDQKWAVIEENLAGIIPDGVLVRLSSVDQGDARSLLNDFAKALYDNVGPQMKNVLVGHS